MIHTDEINWAITFATAAPFTPQPEHEDEHRVEDDAGYRCRSAPRSSRWWSCLRGDEVVESERELHEHRADQVDGDEVDRISDVGVAGSESAQHRLLRRLQDDGERQGDGHEERRAGAQDAFGLLEIAATQFDGRPRRAARAINDANAVTASKIGKQMPTRSSRRRRPRGYAR